MSQGEKICVHCGESCAGQARLKDAKGNYAHKACAEQRSGGGGQAVAAPQQAQRAAPAGEAGSMAAILSDIDEESMIGGAKSCQGCGYPMDDDAMICLHCGFNRNSGRQFNTKVGRDPNKVTAGGKALGAGAKVGGAAAAPLFPIIGGCIAGLLGAAIWGGIAYQFNVEIGWIAVIVGVLCGFGTGFGARGEGGTAVGVIAAVIAIGSIALGKYMAVTWAVNDIFDMDEFSQISIGEVDDSLILTRVADDITRDFLDAGRSIDWPNPEIFVAAAVFPDDFPSEVVDETFEIWDDMTLGDKFEYRNMIADEFDIRPRDVEDEWIRETLAAEICLMRLDAGETLAWSDPYLPLNVSSWPADYPDSIRSQASARWEAMDTNEQQDLRVSVMEEHNMIRDRGGEFGKAIVKEGFIESYSHPLEVLFAFFAIGAAYKVAAYE